MGRNNGKPFGKPNHGKQFGNHQHRKRPYQSAHNNTPKPLRLNVVHTSLKENEIGITEYTTKSKGFTGIIKQRISDFHVNEIGIDGKILKLTDFSIPKPPEKAANEMINADGFIKLVTKEKYDAITAIEEADAKCTDQVLIDVTSLEKEDRTQIHQTMKEIFNKVSSTTITEGDKKFIKCFRFNKKNDRRAKWLWPHEYTYFLLYKENIDTMQAVSSLAPLVNGARASAITYAGTKDKRGKTTQMACIRRREPSLIVNAARRLRNIKVGNFEFRDQPLKLGQHKGNRFRIALRQISDNEDDINESLNSFKENGFVNYYGHQRFGNHASVPTHEVGLHLVLGNFKKACELILKPRENEVPELQAVREHWWKNRNAKEALDMLQRHDRGGNGIEHKLLAGFAKFGPNDHLNSLENIPRNVRLMYIHAYQSLIWNEMASRRISKFGLRLCEGDLVFVNSENISTEILDDENADAGDEQNEQHDESLAPETEQPSENVSTFQAMVKPLTAADIESNKYSIFDLVLPLPGHDITYPSNECAEWYEERLKQDGLSSEKLKHKQKTYSLLGAYRKVFIKPVDLNWYFMRYNSENDTLIRSDADELFGDSEPKSIENGSQKALIVEFSLPSSSYATMALREILKCDTSVASQVHLQQSIAKNPSSTDADAAVDADAAADAQANGAENSTETDNQDDGTQQHSTEENEAKKPKLDISSA